MAVVPKPPRNIAPKWVGLAVLVLLGSVGLWWMGGPTPTPVTLVRTTHAIPAYTLLTPADITTTVASSVTSALTMPAAAIGQITLVPLPARTVVTADKVWKSNVALSNWQIISIPLSVTVPPAVGETVLVVGVDVNADDATDISQRALVLGVENKHAVVALPAAEANRAVTYLFGSRWLLVVRRLP